jgi:hypothetical protein
VCFWQPAKPIFLVMHAQCDTLACCEIPQKYNGQNIPPTYIFRSSHNDRTALFSAIDKL